MEKSECNSTGANKFGSHPVASATDPPGQDCCPPDLQRTAWVPGRVRAALSSLIEGFQYAEHLKESIWEFAVTRPSLRELGITEMDLRWLVRAKLVEFAFEVTLPGESSRQFRRKDRLIFCESLCFVLAAANVEVARRLAAPETASDATSQAGDKSSVEVDAIQSNGNEPDPLIRRAPEWDRDRQELRLGDVVVKRFKAPANNQEMILEAFQEEDWPPRIDDPLPPMPDLEPKRRLHDSINSLNRNQKVQLIRFFGDGSGKGVRWELLDHSGS